MTDAASTADIPVRLGDTADFTTVREFLKASSFTEPALCARTGVATIYHFKAIRDGRTAGLELHDALDLITRLFLDSEPVADADCARLMPAPVRAAMDRLGLLRLLPNGVHGTVLLYPTEGLYCISDQTSPAPGMPALGSDVVYPAVTNNSRTFVEFLPRRPVARMMEVCGGTGIAALVATRFAASTCTADITPRSAVFADFNGRLNGLANYASLQGDMYAPVGDQTFDLIAAHPPYVPAETNSMIFRDGGADGEELVQRVILEGVPRLAPGGILYVTCVASDRKEGRLEQRIRTLLGPLGHDVDVLVVARFEGEPVDFRVRSLLSVKASLAGVPDFARRVKAADITGLVYSHIYLRKRAGAGAVAPARRKVGPATTVAEALWALEMEGLLADPALQDSLLDRRALVNPRSSLLMRYAFDEGWVPAEATHSAEWPFTMAVRGPVWLGDLLLQCDGTQPLRTAINDFRAQGLIVPEITDADLVTLITALALHGTIVVEGLPAMPPAPPLAGATATAPAAAPAVA